MKGDRKSVQLINHSHDPHPILPFYFQRRSERLDWRKIASLDLEKVIQNVDTEELDEFVTPILFCRADSEFDENKIDPGFIKVFKLCQLIGEYLSFSRDKGVEKVITLEARCSLLEEQKVKGDEEAGQLRENLTLAKKELKKTKEMLASTQTQLLGSDNLDEVDQCPYCSKTFLAPSLLLAHLQRRHQGLPIPGNLQQNSTGATANVMFPVQLQGSSSTAFSPMKFSSGGSVGLGGTPTVYAFTLSPDGTVTRNQNQLATATNHNLSNISPPFLENNNNFEKRRNSATQTQTQPSSEETVNTMKKKDSECTGGNDQNGNECSPPHSKFLSKTTKSNSDSDPLLLKVIKYPSPAGGNGNDDSDSEKEAPLPSSQAKHQRQRMQEEHHEADETTSSPSLIPSGLDLNTICDLVEKYLEQKSVASQNQHYDKILKSIYNNMDQFHEFAQNRPSSTTTTTQNPQVAFTTKENYLPTFAVSRGEGVAASSSSSRGPSPSGPNARPLTRSDTNVPTAGGNFDDKGGSSSSPDLERIEGNVLRMKDEFETQWTHLSEKIRDSGIEGESQLSSHVQPRIEELRHAFLTEIKKVQEMILNTPHRGVASSRDDDDGVGTTTATATNTQVVADLGVKVHDNNKSMGQNATSVDGDKELKLDRGMDAHFQKLSDNLESKMTLELQEMKRKLESQDEFWRTQLHTIEQQHQLQIEKLHKDFEQRSSSLSNHVASLTSKLPVSSLDQQGENYYVEEFDSPQKNAGPIAKPRRRTACKEQQEQQGDIQAKSQTRGNSTMKGQNNSSCGEDDDDDVGGRGESISITRRDNVGINQQPSSSSFRQMYPVGDSEEEEDDDDYQSEEGDQGIISSEDPDAEGDYLTIIHAEGDVPEYLHHQSGPVVQRVTTKTTTLDLPSPPRQTRSSPRNPKPARRTRRKSAMMARKPQIREERQLLDDQVSNYTLSTSAENHRRDAQSSDDDGESLSDEGVDAGNGGQRLGKKYSSRNKLAMMEKSSSPKKKYVFDSVQGKLIDASETKSQMDLVRDRIVLNELDTQIANLGIDPTATSIGLEEMKRALKHVKDEKHFMAEDEGEQFQSELNTLRKDVKHEVARRSIQQKLEKYGTPKRKPELNRLSNIFNKVKKSGSSWRQKVASAMKRKRDTPTKKKNKPADDDIKTTFFSKWGRKKKANKDAKENKSDMVDDNNEGNRDDNTGSSEDEEESSSSDVEMPPYMTRSQPILLDRRSNNSRRGGGESRRKSSSGNRKPNRDSDSASESEEIGQPPKSPHSHHHLSQNLKPKLKPRRVNNPPAPLPASSPKSPPNRNAALHGQLVSELQAKFNKNKSPAVKHNESRTSPPPTKFKVPNFFVTGPPIATTTSPHRTAVTSNGWSEETLQEFGKNAKLMGNGSPLVSGQEQRRGNGRTGSKRSPEEEKNPSRRHTKGSTLATTTSVLDLVSPEKRKQQMSFARSDDRRKGFRRKSSSLSLSDEGDGHRDEIHRNASNQHLSPRDGRYVVSQHSSSPHHRPKFHSPHDTITRISSGPLPVGRNHNNLEFQRSRATRSSPPEADSSDTSAWDTEEEEEIHAFEGDDYPAHPHADGQSQGQSTSTMAVVDYNYRSSSSDSNYDSHPGPSSSRRRRTNQPSSSNTNRNMSTKEDQKSNNGETNENLKIMKSSILSVDFTSDEETSRSQFPTTTATTNYDAFQKKYQQQDEHQKSKGFNYSATSMSQSQQHQQQRSSVSNFGVSSTSRNNLAAGAGGKFGTAEVTLERPSTAGRRSNFTRELKSPDNSWDSD